MDMSTDCAGDAPGAQVAATPPDSRRAGAAAPPAWEVLLTLVALAATAVATVMAGRELAGIMSGNVAAGEWGALGLHVAFSLIVLVLIYGGLVYQLTRLSYLLRRRAHRPAPREAMEAVFDGDAPSLTVLVPSYKEEPHVVYTTLLSAALQEYPNRRVVLLVDDPPNPGALADARRLAVTRGLVDTLQGVLQVPAERFQRELSRFLGRCDAARARRERETARLAALNRLAAEWFQGMLAEWPEGDHADRLFCERVLQSQARALRERAAELMARGLPELRWQQAAHREYRRLAALFTAEISCFERKRYANLSHEPNKAMNLNSYIGLMGRSFRELRGPEGLALEPARRSLDVDVEVPDADFVITLDADSVILPDYALRLVHEMRRAGNERLAVIQTPYSAFPGAPGALERIAGATTDIQYIIHQGFTGWDATYWVGANALLRMDALRDIAQHDTERGHPITRYIQDRTVIEDTESSIDLVDRGWRLHNYPERLAFSATPPDFGSLLIQRRRWANGGLIILPKLLRFLARGPERWRKLPQGFMRVHYLGSIAAVNAGLLLILAVPFTDAVESWWLPMTALPYFALYGRDLVRLGYRPSDLIRVYALNLVLIPVNLGGVLKSLQQAWTRDKIPFGRTPKVHGRTAAAPLYLVAEFLILGHWYLAGGFDLAEGRWVHGAFALANASLLLYGIAAFIGLRESVEDLQVAWARWRSDGVEAADAAGPAPSPRLPGVRLAGRLPQLTSDLALLGPTERWQEPAGQADAGLRPQRA